MEPLRSSSSALYNEKLPPINNSLKSEDKRTPQYTFSFFGSTEKYHVFINGKEFLEICNEKDGSCVAQAKLYDAVAYVSDKHELDGKFYLAFSLANSNAESVYCFDKTKGNFECIVGRISRPEFIGNRLIEFGTGCDDNRPEITGFVITFYDLDKAEKPRQCGKIIEKVGRYWSLSVDHKKKIISGCDQTVYSKEYEIPGLRV